MGRLDRILSTLDAARFDDTILGEHNLEFPINDYEELLRIENLARRKKTVRNTLMEYFQTFKPSSFTGKYNKKQGGLHHIMTDELFMQFNWRGVGGKFPLKDMFLFNSVLYGKVWKLSFDRAILELGIFSFRIMER
jgi:Domain of unknown function (DUF4806)